MLARILVTAAALAAGVWLALGLHSARLLHEAQSIAFTDPAELRAADVERARDLFDRGRRHTPDTLPWLVEAGMLARAGRDREGIAAAREAVRREPENAEAWAFLAVVAQRPDPRLAAAAGDRARELNPTVPPER